MSVPRQLYDRKRLYGAAGVYALINEELGTISYIGASTNIYTRLVSAMGRLRKGTFPGKLLQDSFYRSGNKSVSLEILEETSLEDLRVREKYWIQLYCPEGNSMHTFRDVVRMEKIKPSIIEANQQRWQDPEFREKMMSVHVGRKHTKEARRKMSLAQQGKKRSLESRKKTGDTLRGKPWSEKRRAAQRGVG